MSKRLISLALCLLMLTGVFLTSCGKEELEVSASDAAKTLTMYVITETQVYYTDAEYAALSAEDKQRVHWLFSIYSFFYSSPAEFLRIQIREKSQLWQIRYCLLPKEWWRG